MSATRPTERKAVNSVGADATTVGKGSPYTEEIRCSFCGKSRDEVKGIVCGETPWVAICDECVALCNEILAERNPLS